MAEAFRVDPAALAGTSGMAGDDPVGAALGRRYDGAAARNFAESPVGQIIPIYGATQPSRPGRRCRDPPPTAAPRPSTVRSPGVPAGRRPGRHPR
ncbi:hypothetical protein MAHJHV63_50830 [Mycobacterium avium subsp. hominissuis]